MKKVMITTAAVALALGLSPFAGAQPVDNGSAAADDRSKAVVKTKIDDSYNEKTITANKTVTKNDNDTKTVTLDKTITKNDNDTKTVTKTNTDSNNDTKTKDSYNESTKT
jgi:hypothetical protein